LKPESWIFSIKKAPPPPPKLGPGFFLAAALVGLLAVVVFG